MNTTHVDTQEKMMAHVYEQTQCSHGNKKQTISQTLEQNNPHTCKQAYHSHEGPKRRQKHIHI